MNTEIITLTDSARMPHLHKSPYVYGGVCVCVLQNMLTSGQRNAEICRAHRLLLGAIVCQGRVWGNVIRDGRVNRIVR